MKEMKISYLIQRLKAPYPKDSPLSNFGNAFSFGGGYVNGGLSNEAMEYISDVFSFDYMGAAEFEFGALPEAFGKMIDYDLIAESIEVDRADKTKCKVFYICNKDHRIEVRKRIKSWSKSEAYGETKERVGLCAAVNNEKYANYIGWIELDNGFMFFLDEKAATKMAAAFIR